MRTFVDIGFTTNTEMNLSTFQADPAAWFTAQGSQGDQTWLLAYAEDCVIWGKLADGELLLSQSDQLHAITLLEARLFGENGEVHVWRTDDGFAACHVTDQEDSETAGAYDEWQRLWGVEAEGRGNGFTKLVDGQEGFRHTVPLIVPDRAFHRSHPRFHPTILKTRHYFTVDGETGATSIALSRLVSIDAESFDEYRERVNNNE